MPSCHVVSQDLALLEEVLSLQQVLVQRLMKMNDLAHLTKFGALMANDVRTEGVLFVLMLGQPTRGTVWADGTMRVSWYSV